MSKVISYQLAGDPVKFQQGRALFMEYAESLGIDLAFQNFSNELENMHRQYAAPAGALLIAYDADFAVGCSGIRKIDAQTAELKRMYVKSNYRGLHIGAALLQRSIELAIGLGYKRIRLDTLANMTGAQALYRSFGFYEIGAYRFNPLSGTIFMEKQLRG